MVRTVLWTPFESIEEVTECIHKSKFNIKTLKEIVKNNNVYINNRYRKNEIIDEIIEGAEGAKLKFKVLKCEIWVRRSLRSKIPFLYFLVFESACLKWNY